MKDLENKIKALGKAVFALFLEYNWITCDKNGIVRAFDKKPEVDKSVSAWVCDKNYVSYKILGRISLVNFVPNWQELCFSREECKESMQKQYLRIGEIPLDGKSKVYNYVDNSILKEEIGVSVFEYIEGCGIVVPNTPQARDDFLILMKSYWKPQYIVTGKEVGIGADGEPLLEDVKIVKTLKPAKLREECENVDIHLSKTGAEIDTKKENVDCVNAFTADEIDRIKRAVIAENFASYNGEDAKLHLITAKCNAILKGGAK